MPEVGHRESGKAAGQYGRKIGTLRLTDDQVAECPAAVTRHGDAVAMIGDRRPDTALLIEGADIRHEVMCEAYETTPEIVDLGTPEDGEHAAQGGDHTRTHRRFPPR